ncbi:uncharacterized protein LOC108869284 isoform X2 [Brassica rapa]|uniref:Replication factor A C-terminal domain-containing protein n=4 Tax=Brassica TaxID=3705 RepID=A0ABQ7XCL3_BRANA|nr:uncharacterized protein LOC108869284 isoform X2 [Brassica rapa]KAH0852927.1 hypothetical protein HID58_093604 [Brassica napus]
MNSNSKNSASGDLISKKPNGKDAVSSAAPVKPSAASMKPSAAAMKISAAPTIPSVASMKPIGQSGVSGDSSSTKRNGKAVVCSDVPSDNSDRVVFFKDVTFGPQEDELRFRLIHFWEAKHAFSKILMGLEMLLVDAEGTVIQGFIPPSRMDTYLRHMKPGSTYRLTNFFGSKTKKVYRVADPDVTIAFSWKSVLSDLTDTSTWFPEDRFRFHGYEQFEAACDLKGDLYDFIGHIKLVNEQALNESFVLDEVEIASDRRILVHVQTHDGPVMKLYIWDKVATAFCEKFISLGKPPSVIMVTTVNPKRLGGALSLSSLSSSRVFFDTDVHQTREYLAWLESNSEVANRVNAEIVTKAETATIGELLTYMKQEGAKVAWFECTATIDDVVRGSAWYYIACGGCKTKATKGPTTLMCRKCGKTEITGAAEYLSKLSVYDNNDHASFVLLGDAGFELTGKKASVLVESYYEANEGSGDDHVVPVPQVLIDTIGQKRTFVIKISKHNLEGKTQALTVTKVLPLEVPALGYDLAADVVVSPTADEGVKRGADMIVSDDAKRAKSG